MKHRYIVTSAYRVLLSDKLQYLGSHTNRREASDHATRIREAGGRALVHDRFTGLVIRDTGKPYGQVWAGSSKKGQKSPEWMS